MVIRLLVSSLPVFSTHVEVFLLWTIILFLRLGFLHARGGVSLEALNSTIAEKFSPRTWRCFQPEDGRNLQVHVFSTHVEVFPKCTIFETKQNRFLHARGGVSTVLLWVLCLSWFSPRTWRCFRCYGLCEGLYQVFSTHVEVFPEDKKFLTSKVSFLHARGGVSRLRTLNCLTVKFSPRTWRCFRHRLLCLHRQGVFSTHVEVFLLADYDSNGAWCFLHARGGVSFIFDIGCFNLGFSPRTWRCFPSRNRPQGHDRVFSTHVEVFLRDQNAQHFL